MSDEKERLPDHLVRPTSRRQLRDEGVSRRQLLRTSRRWARTSHGFYVPASVDATTVGQRLAQHSIRLPSDGAVGEWASGFLHGLPYCDGLSKDGRTRVDVPLYVGRRGRIHEVEGTRVSREPLPASDLTEIAGIPCTVPLRSCSMACETHRTL